MRQYIIVEDNTPEVAEYSICYREDNAPKSAYWTLWQTFHDQDKAQQVCDLLNRDEKARASS